MLINQPAHIESTLFCYNNFDICVHYTAMDRFVATAVRDCRALAQRPQVSKGSTLRQLDRSDWFRSENAELQLSSKSHTTTRSHASAFRSKLKIETPGKPGEASTRWQFESWKSSLSLGQLIARIRQHSTTAFKPRLAQ